MRTLYSMWNSEDQKMNFKTTGKFVETDPRVIRMNELHRLDQETMDMIGIGKQNRRTKSGKMRKQ